MIYFSGDIHGFPWDLKKMCKKLSMTKEDILILLGDVGANYYGNERDDAVKQALAGLGPTVLCIHGNHEMRPWHVPGYREAIWNGGRIWV